jgi:hypothetical protein
MEGVTAFAWGPLSFLAVYGLATSKHWRFTLMSIISLGQFYGCVLYFTTCQHIGQYITLILICPVHLLMCFVQVGMLTPDQSLFTSGFTSSLSMVSGW